jgi:hypothetical protein
VCAYRQQEDQLRGSFHRFIAVAVAAALTFAMTAAPCFAQQDKPAARPSLAKLSPASLKALSDGAARPALRAQETPVTPGSFFRTRKGAVALALVAAGAAFTVWSINHDRKPVKSPVR